MALGSYDIAVIGGGILGTATAMTLTQRFPNKTVAVLEKEDEVAQHQTGHNSGVIHAGIYYAPGSHKANLCTEGSKSLRRFCDDRGIPYEMCGKVVVATEESQLGKLDELHRRGTANGAEGLEIIPRERLLELEPHASGLKAVYSPNSGIVDYGRVTRAYAEEMVANGAELLTGTNVRRVAYSGARTVLETDRGDLSAAHVINCAGLHADSVARSMGVDPGLRIIPFRGEYFSLKADRAHLVKGLVYPVPDPKLPFLGVHFTKRIGGGVEAGPNAVLALAREGYRKSSLNARDLLGTLSFVGFWRMSMSHWKTGVKEAFRSYVKRAFLRSLQTLVPEVRMEDLADPGAGVRAQAVDRKGNLLQDFAIVRSANAIHVLNAPSPAATSSLAIGSHIVNEAAEVFGLTA